MAAPVTDFTSFTAQLNHQFGAGSDEVVTGHIGRNLTRAGAWGEEVFAKTGAHTPAEIGTVMAHMTKLADKMDWSTAVFTWDGEDDMIRFFQHNHETTTEYACARRSSCIESLTHPPIDWPPAISRASSEQWPQWSRELY